MHLDLTRFRIFLWKRNSDLRKRSLTSIKSVRSPDSIVVELINDIYDLPRDLIHVLKSSLSSSFSRMTSTLIGGKESIHRACISLLSLMIISPTVLRSLLPNAADNLRSHRELREPWRGDEREREKRRQHSPRLPYSLALQHTCLSSRWFSWSSQASTDSSLQSSSFPPCYSCSSSQSPLSQWLLEAPASSQPGTGSAEGNSEETFETLVSVLEQGEELVPRGCERMMMK